MQTFHCRALLIDIDGTLVDSLPAVDRAWTNWAKRHQMDQDEVLTKIHGRRSLDSLRLLRPDLDAEEENAWLRHAESIDTEGVIPIPGALDLIGKLPAGCFAIVTSGTSDVAHARLTAVGIEIPAVGVYGEDVADGKPHPAPYLLAASRLNVDPKDCLVFEDTTAGIASGKAAGMKVVALATWQSADDLKHADAIVPNFLSVAVTSGDDGLTVSVT
jgi:sugar-phosphatase